MIDMEKIQSDDLNNVTGGVKASASVVKQPRMVECPNCHHIFEADVMKPTAKCPKCPYVIEFKG